MTSVKIKDSLVSWANSAPTSVELTVLEQGTNCHNRQSCLNPLFNEALQDSRSGSAGRWTTTWLRVSITHEPANR